MGENQALVPEIPEAVKNKIFSASDIKWVKNVNDSKRNGRNYCSAYIIPTDIRVKPKSNGVFFCLQIHETIRGWKNSLMQVPIGDLILLHQNLNNQKTKCFTHLVTPIDNNVILKPNNPNNPDDWPGRWVKVIAMTENQVGKSIIFKQTGWLTAGFSGQYQDLRFQQGRIRKIPPIQQLSALQNDIWNRFQPWRV